MSQDVRGPLPRGARPDFIAGEPGSQSAPIDLCDDEPVGNPMRPVDPRDPRGVWEAPVGFRPSASAQAGTSNSSSGSAANGPGKRKASRQAGSESKRFSSNRPMGGFKPIPAVLPDLDPPSDMELEPEPDGTERKRKAKPKSKSKRAGQAKTRVSRFWCFTVFPDPESGGLSGDKALTQDWDPLETWILERAGTFDDGGLIRYLVIGREICPDTGRLHGQGYVEFAQLHSKTMGAVKTDFEDDTLHLGVRQFSRQAAREYCLKDGMYVEFGKWLEGGQGTRSDLNDVSEMVLEGKPLGYIAQEAGPEFIKYSNGIIKQKLYAMPPKFRDDIKVYVYWGKPGVGKTKMVGEIVEKLKQQEGKAYFWHTLDKNWFDGYDGEEVVVINDFNGQIDFEHFIELLDRYPAKVAVKGGRVAWNATRIYITSNKHPSEWYAGMHYNIGQIARRLTKVRHVKAKSVDELSEVVDWHDGSDVEMDENFNEVENE